MTGRFVATATLALACATPLPAADWPQWRGPERDGKARESGLLQAWPAEGPPLDWKASGLGSGFSSVAVVGGRVFTLGDHGDAQYALALDRGSRQIVWKTKVGPAWKDEFLGPRSTPTVDGERVYVLSTEGDLYCLNAENGAELWKRSLVADFGAAMMKYDGTHEWKFSESPLVDGDRVIVTPGSSKAVMVALDTKTGKEVWRSAMPALGERGTDGAGYASIVISNGGGVKQYVQLVGRGAIGIEAATGKFLWGYNRIANGTANIPTPLVRGDEVFVSTGYRTGAALLRLAKAETGVAAREVYFLDAETAQNHHGNMILHDGYVYFGTGHNKGFPLALELGSGKVAWGPERNGGEGSAAVACAEGRLYYRYQNGKMVLIEATPEAYRERGSFAIPDVSHPSWAHPAIADGRLWLREQDALLVYDLRLRRTEAEPAAETKPKAGL